MRKRVAEIFGLLAQLVAGSDQSIDLPVEIQLTHELLLRSFHPRIESYFQRLFVSLAVHREPDCVLARHHPGFHAAVRKWDTRGAATAERDSANPTPPDSCRPACSAAPDEAPNNRARAVAARPTAAPGGWRAREPVAHFGHRSPA